MASARNHIRHNKGSSKTTKNLNDGNLNFKENQTVSEREAMRALLYSPSTKNIINEVTLRSYKTLFNKNKLSPNIIEEIMKASGFEKGETQWKFTNNKI